MSENYERLMKANMNTAAECMRQVPHIKITVN